MPELASLEPSETALLLIGYQNEFASDGGKMHRAVRACMREYGMLDNTKVVLDSARRAGVTVVHVPITYEKGHNEIAKEPYGILAGIKSNSAFTSSSWNADFIPSMKPLPSELVVKGKVGLCSFHSTNLDFLLRQNNIRNVILAGFLTNCDVESTMRQAYERGYRVYTLKDCCAATSVEAHDAVFEHSFVLFSIPTNSRAIATALGGCLESSF